MTDSHAPTSESHLPGSGKRGSSQRILLLLLVLLLAVFGYLYLFTDLIRPHQELPNHSDAQPPHVKQPIPARPEVKGEKPVAPTSAEGQKSVAALAKPAIPVKPAVALVPPVVSVAKSAATPASATAKPDMPTEKHLAKSTTCPAPLPAKATKQMESKPAAAVKPLQKDSKPVVRKGGGPYTLLIGDFVLGASVKSAQAKLRKAAIDPMTKKSVKRQMTMNRLFLAEFGDYGAAQAEMKKLEKLTSDAFILPENGKYAVYAGSYYVEWQAAVEQDRLYDKGVKLAMKKVTAPIMLTRLTAGSFDSRDKALKAAACLKKQGLDAQLVKAGNQR